MSKYNYDIKLTPHNIDTLLMDRISDNSLVLEFGAANGRMTKYMTQEKNCNVYCVEIDPIAANDCKEFCEKIVIADIESNDWQWEFKDIQFDFILFADVLEHLYDPCKILNGVKEFLKPNGKILISIPNIAHNSIIMSLLNDEFEYRNLGLLDNTHIRFFTKKSLDKLFLDCGYKTTYISANFAKPQKTEFSFNYADFSSAVVDALSKRKYGHAYQFCYELINQDSHVGINVEEIDLDEKNLVRLYLDTGSGFNENEVKYLWGKNYGEFNISEDKNILRLGLHPSMNSCRLSIKYIKVVDINNLEHICRIESTNSNYFINNELVFFTNDPQLIINIPTTMPVKLIFDINYHDIFLSNDEIARFNIIDEYAALLASQNQQLINILNSKSWQITKPIRYLKRLLKK